MKQITAIGMDLGGLEAGEGVGRGHKVVREVSFPVSGCNVSLNEGCP